MDFARCRQLDFLKKRSRATLSQAALRFCLDNPNIATVVPGITNVTELEEIVSCSELPPLDAQELVELQRPYYEAFKSKPLS